MEHNVPEQKRRVLLKLSGEAFGAGSLGVNPDVVGDIAREIAKAAQDVEIAIVVGGGNFFRGAELSQRGMERSRADYMGMLGTVMNALALQDFLEQAGVDTRVQSAISMAQVTEAYIPLRAIRHLEKGRVVIFGAGAGLPYFSTDTVAAQRALEIKADEVLVAKNGVDGVYTADPKKDASATKLAAAVDFLVLPKAVRTVLSPLGAVAPAAGAGHAAGAVGKAGPVVALVGVIGAQRSACSRGGELFQHHHAHVEALIADAHAGEMPTQRLAVGQHHRAAPHPTG